MLKIESNFFLEYKFLFEFLIYNVSKEESMVQIWYESIISS